MKEKRFRRTMVAAAILGTSLSMSSFSCVKPLQPQPSDVSNVESSYDASSEIPVIVYGPPVEESSFNPSEEIPEPVYGPPPAEQKEPSEQSFDPAEEIPEPVYGPPPAEQRETSEQSFEPAEEIPVLVYGPPNFE